MEPYLVPRLPNAASPSGSLPGDQLSTLAVQESTEQSLVPPRQAPVTVAQLPLDEQRRAFTPEAVGRVAGFAIIDGQLTATIRHLPSRHEVRGVPLSTDLITTLGVGWAAAMGLAPAELEVVQHAFPQFHWGAYIEAAEELSVWIHKSGAEASEACRQRLLVALHPPPLKLHALKSQDALLKLILHEVPLQAPARNRVAFMVQVCNEWGQILGRQALWTPVWLDAPGRPSLQGVDWSLDDFAGYFKGSTVFLPKRATTTCSLPYEQRPLD